MNNRFAEKRRRYLREHRDGIYTGMLLTGKLDEHLKEIGGTAQEMFDRLVAQMKDAEGVTERLKAEKQMEWVGRMNSICSRAEEANFDFNRLSESRKQELDRMVADFSEAGCLFVEDLFLEFLIDADNGIDRSDDKLVATFDDECGHELVFILSQEEVHYVIHAISEKLDNIVCEGGTPFGEDENEEGIVSLSPVNTEEELDMLLAHVLGDDGGGADD